MKRPFPFLAIPLAATLLFGGPALAQSPPEVREFKSQSGSRLKAMILGIDDSGRVLLQPYSAKAVPLTSLSAEDQAFVEAWKQRKADEAQWIDEGERASYYRDPGVSLLNGTLRTLDGSAWKPYEPADPSNLRYVAYYFSREHPDDEFLDAVSEAYEKLRKKSELFEVVYITLGTSDQDVKDYAKSKEFAFPVFDPSSIGLINKSVVGGLFRGRYPQMVVVDRNAAVQVDSFRGKDETPQLLDTLEQFEEMVTKATREQKRAAARAK